MKVLAIQFKYLGDVVVATPALRALKAHLGEGSQLHVLVAQEAVPLIAHVPWIDRVWGFPRSRKRLRPGEALPIVRALRRERFDASIDLAGNDRGALVSRFAGAARRIGVVEPRGPSWRRACYTTAVEAFDTTRHESIRMWSPVSELGVPFPQDMRAEIRPDPARQAEAREYLRGADILCYVTASQPKRQWPLSHWARLDQLARERGIALAFTGGNTPREREALDQLRAHAPAATILPPAEPLETLLAALAMLKVFVTADTGPMHFAAALGVRTIGIFGPTASSRWMPLGDGNVALQGGLCPCSGHLAACVATRACIDAIEPQRVLDAIQPSRP